MSSPEWGTTYNGHAKPVKPGLEPARKNCRTGRTGIILFKKEKEGLSFFFKNIPVLPVLQVFLAGSSPGFTGSTGGSIPTGVVLCGVSRGMS